jgi:hypothetical protein
MNLFEHPIDEALYLILNMPWWVYLVFLYCIVTGWKSLHPRVISYYRLFILPVLFGILSIPLVFLRYSLSEIHVSAWLISCSISGWCGWWIYQNVSIQADKHKRLIRVPGTRSTLISILLILFSRFFFGYMHATSPDSLTNDYFIYSDITASGLIVGFILGRSLSYLSSYRQSHHTNLFKD